MTTPSCASRSPLRWSWGALLAFGLTLGFSLTGSGRLRATPSPLDHARRAEEAISALEFDEARRELLAGAPDDPAIALERGRLALYEADCDGALVVLSRPDVANSEPGAVLLDIARGCARVTAATVVVRDEEQGVEIRFQDEFDRPLAPIMIATVVRARAALTSDLGVTWPRPTRITVVRDLLSLSAMTGLPYESAQTTGTVAVAKWGRVTLLTPRASPHGYSWQDTLAHELTHLAVTRATVDRAPLWLQEGLAKREEVRWREPGPFDDRPPVDTVVLRGMELKLDLSLDKLGPSIAMLPSADAAMVAFAEVTSFVHFLAVSTPPESLPRLLLALREQKTPDEALAQTTGLDLKGWDAKWRGYLAGRGKEPLPALFGLGSDPPHMRDLRDRVRLAELLLGREHPAEALLELDRAKAKTEAAQDPSIRALRAQALRRQGALSDAEAALGDVHELAASYGPWWALRGILTRAHGDEAAAAKSFGEALAADPLSVAAACEGDDPASSPKDPGLRPLCDAARARGEPAPGRE